VKERYKRASEQFRSKEYPSNQLPSVRKLTHRITAISTRRSRRELIEMRVQDAMNQQYEEFRLALGARIKQLRKERGWSLSRMVLDHGYADTQWRRYERTGALTIESLLRIATIFELSLSKLLNGLAEFPAKSVAEIEGKNPPKSAEAKDRSRLPIQEDEI